MSVLSTAAAMVVAYLLGWFAWTFGEYVMHRGVMHELRGRGMPSREHLNHHADRDSILEKWPLAWGGIIALGVFVLYGDGVKVLPAPVAAALAAGWIGGYGFYDWMHFRAHRRQPFGWAPLRRYERWLRRHHFHHHFGHPMRNHGVTVPWWDMVFRTEDRLTGPVAVPRRMAMVWLTDEAGTVRPEHAGEYVVVGTREASADQLAADKRDAHQNLAPAV